jgi:hypothetical protein
MTADQVKSFIAHVGKALELDRPGKTVRDWLDKHKDEASVRTARRRLVEYGFPEEVIKRFPADQVHLLDQKREYEVRRDEVMKLMTLPPWQGEALFRSIKTSKDDTLFGSMVPALQKIRRAQGRLEQRMALLRHVEALRLYAADHDGKLPQKLADIPVPLPVDPFSGKSFDYKTDGTTAYFRGSPPPGEEKNAVYNLHYQVTIQK